MATGKTTKRASPSRPFKAAEHLKTEAEIAAYIEAMLEDGDARAVPIALRTVADSVGGMTALAQRTKLSRETLYRTLSRNGNPRLVVDGPSLQLHRPDHRHQSKEAK